jgi:hypothetical protein
VLALSLDKGRFPFHARLLAAMFCGAFLLGCAHTAHAQPIRLYDGSDGASCDYFNAAAGQHWRHRQGDWVDAQGKEQGATPFARSVVKALNTSRPVEWDVTPLVQAWYSGAMPNQGFLLRTVPGTAAAVAVFLSREAESEIGRPALALTYADGKRERVVATADTVLDCSTYKGLGQMQTFGIGSDRNALVYFDLPALGARQLTKATLQLTTTDRQYGDAEVGIYRLQPPVSAGAAKPEFGLAAKYPNDEGIEGDPDVYMFTGFDAAGLVGWWRSAWSFVRETWTFDVVSSDAALGFEPLHGKALRVNLPKGKNLGLDMGYVFADKQGHDPEEVYFRYYLRFANDWKPDVDGGKLPGISGTYGQAGWGLRRSDGTNGWSMRGSFGRWSEKDNPLYGYTPLGTYAYHADTEDYNGEGWGWESDQRGLLLRDRWYCIEQYFKVNTLGRKDGVMRAWVDGVLVFEKTDIRVRTVPKIKIEQVWMNVYHGGTAPSPHDQHLYIDDVVIAKRYIGPMTAR